VGDAKQITFWIYRCEFREAVYRGWE